MKMSINFNDVEYGKNENHLKFKAHIPRYDVNREFEFDYIGTETTSNSSMSDERLERLTEELQKTFGYAPFNLEDVQKKLENKKQYQIDM